VEREEGSCEKASNLLTVLILVILMTVPGFAANGQYYSGYWGVTSML